MNKEIIITQLETGETTLKVNAGVKWSTFIIGIEMMIECIIQNAEKDIDINFILEDIKRIYERDNEKINEKTQKED